MPLCFRPARLEDFEFCANLYFAGRDRATLDMDALTADLQRRWDVSEVRIITLDGTDVGWLQSRTQDGALFIVQFFIDAPFQGRGIGTEVMHQIIEEACTNDQPVTLGVVKTNPAQRLYQRLGFQTTHEDDRKFYMKRDQA